MNTTRMTNNTRLSVRVTATDLANWRFSAKLTQTPLSDMIRAAVNGYVAKPPPSFDLTDLPFSLLANLLGNSVDRSSLRKTTLRDQSIVLRVSSSDWERWKIAAQLEHRSVSAMIRRAVTRHVYPFVEAGRLLGLRGSSAQRTPG